MPSRIPRGYYRWTIEKPGGGALVVAPETRSHMDFSLTRQQQAPPGMVYAAGGPWASFNSFIGWMGPYTFPAYYMDRYEVTNFDYQKFVDSGGYQNPRYWPATFQKDGHTLSWTQAMQLFRDAAGRPGPSTWTAGHYPKGKADLPVSGVSWFEAQAYAQFAGKTLPVIGQWYEAAEFDVSPYTVQLSNFRGNASAAVGSSQGLGPYGTYDLGGNVREWTANAVEGDLHFILCGSWRSPCTSTPAPKLSALRSFRHQRLPLRAQPWPLARRLCPAGSSRRPRFREIQACQRRGLPRLRTAVRLSIYPAQRETRRHRQGNP